MELYSPEQMSFLDEHHFAFIKIEIADHVLTITLDRAEKKNALHPQMINEIAFAMHFAHFSKDIWVVIFEANGNVFCAGGDLKAMAGFIEENDSTIPEPNGEVLIAELFNKLHKPTITKVTGDVYAGGFFFLAASTYTVALDHIQLGLPEVKRGLYPMQVMATLLKVMPARKVIDWCIRGYNLPVVTAAEWGLITHVVKMDNMDDVVDEIISDLKSNSPTAIKLGLEAYDHISPTQDQHKYLYTMLQKAIQSNDGQEGLAAFKEKRKPIWTGE